MIVVQFSLSETSGGLWCSILLSAGSVVRSDQVAQVFPHSAVENLQGWRPHNLSGHPVPVFYPPYDTSLYPQGEKASPTPSLKLSCFNLCLLSLVLLSCTTVKSLLDYLLAVGHPEAVVSPG